MGFNNFWINNDGKKEQLNNAKHGVRKEQIDKKFHNLFDAYDVNCNGTLESEELERIFASLSKFSGSDNVLDATENKQVSSLFSNQVGIKDADFQGFVKSVSDAGDKIISSTEKRTSDGGKEVKTEYKDGTIETIAYYPNGDFKWKKIVKHLSKTVYEMSINGEKREITEEQFKKASKRQEETKNKPQVSMDKGAEGQKVLSALPTQNIKLNNKVIEWDENKQIYSPRFIAEKLGIDINSEDGKKILERISYLSQEALEQVKDGTEVKELLSQNDLSPSFDNISNVLEFVYGVTLRNEDEYEAAKPQRDKIIQQLQTVAVMSELYARVAEFNDTYTDNQGLFGIGAEGFQWILNKIGIDGENHYQWADSCREFIEKINGFKTLNPEKFEAEFKELTGKSEFNVNALQKMTELAKSGKAQDSDGNYTEEYKQAVKEFSDFDITNPNAKAWYHPENLMNGFGEALIMIMTLGWGSETKAGQMLATSTMSTFSKAGVAVASKQFNNKLLQGAAKLCGQGVKLLGPALNEGTKMYAYTVATGTAANAANRAIKFDSEENSLDKFLQAERMVLEGAAGSFAFGAFAGIFGSTVTQKVMQSVSKVSTKVGTALSDKFAKGAVDAREVFATILEKSAPTKIAEAAAFAVDVLGFTAFESALAIAKNIKGFPDDVTIEDVVDVLAKEFQGQTVNLGQIKGISYLIMWLTGSRSARLQATKYMRENMPQLKGAKVEGVNGGKDGYKINLADGRTIECKNTNEMISALHLMVRKETAFSKKFDKKTNVVDLTNLDAVKAAKFIELVKAGKDTEAVALLKDASLEQTKGADETSELSPYNITQIATPEEVGVKAEKALAGSKHRIATAGYSAPPEGYEVATRDFLKALDEQLGSEQTSFVTSPTADKGSIDAITTEVAGFDKGRLFYTTAKDYVDYINPDNFPATIDKASYSTVPKFVLPDAASYSAATAKASNAFIATGGRNATVSDFVNAIKNGNKAVILDNTTLDVPAWGEAKGRVENASKYLSEQIKAVREGRELPYPEIGEFTRQFIEENITKFEALTRTYQIDSTPESVKIAAQKSAAFIESKFLTDAPLSAKSPLIQNSKVSMISKPNDVEGIVPDLTAGDKVLSDYGLVKDGDKWYAPNREWFPRAITEDDIIIVYGRDANGKPSNIGFCSKSEFSSLYTDRAKYKNGSIEFINAENLPKGQVVEATKCASGEVCILPVGTKLETNEGIVEVKPGEIVIINEAKNSVYATNITEILKRYKNDPLNPASKELFNLLNEFAAKESTLSETEKLNYHQKIADSFGRLNRGQKLYELAPDAAENPPQTLRQEYDLAAKIATDFETKFLSRIDVSNFDTALTQAKSVLTEIYQDTSLTPLQKQAAVTSVMVKLLPKTNAHQHTKGSLPKETAMQLAQKKGYTQEQIAELEAAYSAGEAGFATLTDFNNAYGTIGRLVNTPSDYKIAIDGIIRKAVSEGQLTTEIRCACDSLRDENGRYLSPEEGTKVILDAIEETKAQLRAEGKEVPATGYVFLTYRGKDWDASLSAATVQAKQAVKTAMEHPAMKFGFDIAGPEDSGWGPKAFEESLGIIREYNERVAKGEVQGQKIGITMHAGETPTFDGGRPGYESVREAIEMGADRIGHGVQAVLDDATMQMMKDADVTVEICGVCNIQSIPINTQGLAIHPIQQFIDRGIKVSLCTDNDAICGSNITKEYNQFLLTGHSNFMNWNNVKQSARDGIEAAFIPESAKVEARDMLENRINQIQNMLNEVAGQYDGITSIETKMANGRAVRVGVLDVFGEKHRGIAINGVEKDFAHGDLVAGALQSYVNGQDVDIVKFPVKVSDPKRYDSDGKLISSNTKSNLRLDPRSLLKELKKLNSLPEEQKLDYLNLSNSISLEYKVNGREISPADLANPEIRAEIRASLPEAVEHILQELETLVNNGTEVYISAGNRRNTFSAFSLVEGIHTIGGKNLATGEALSYLTNHALIEEHVGLPLYMTGAKGGSQVMKNDNIKGVRMAGIIDQQSPLAKMSKWQLSKKVATNADYAELKQYADQIIAAGKKKIDINFFQYSFAFSLPEKFRYKIYDTQRFIAMFEGHLEPEVLEYIKPMGTHCDIQYRQFFDMKAKEGHHVMPMSKTTAVRNTVSGTSFGPAQVIARKIKEEQEK